MNLKQAIDFYKSETNTKSDRDRVFMESIYPIFERFTEHLLNRYTVSHDLREDMKFELLCAFLESLNKECFDTSKITLAGGYLYNLLRFKLINRLEYLNVRKKGQEKLENAFNKNRETYLV